MTMTEKIKPPHPWHQLAENAFVASLFNREQCDSLLFAINNPLNVSEKSEQPPNSMHEYGKVIDDPMLEYWIDELGNKRLRKVIEQLFPQLPHYDLSHHYAFLTSYSADQNQDLALHVDASHITLNICLQSNCQGSDLVFTGSRCQQHVDSAPDKNRAVRFRQGDAVIHSGNQRHFVTALAGGSRHNLVIWFRLEDEPFDHDNDWLKQTCPDCKK